MDFNDLAKPGFLVRLGQLQTSWPTHAQYFWQCYRFTFIDRNFNFIHTMQYFVAIFSLPQKYVIDGTVVYAFCDSFIHVEIGIFRSCDTHAQ